MEASMYEKKKNIAIVLMFFCVLGIGSIWYWDAFAPQSASPSIQDKKLLLGNSPSAPSLDTARETKSEKLTSPRLTYRLEKANSTHDSSNAKTRYQALIKRHPYYQREPLARKAWKAIPKKDRPDLAMEQNILMTLDPSLGFVPSERGLQAYLDTRAKLFTQSDAAIEGVSWLERGPNNVGGRTRALMFDPTDSLHRKVWAGGVSGGLWFNENITNAQSSWIRVNDFWSNLAITTLAYDPSNPQTFYAGTGEGFFNQDAVRGGGIWKTSNGGLSWEQLPSTIPSSVASGESEFSYIQKILVNQQGHIFAATRGERIDRGGLLKSTDGGISWTKILAPRFSGQLSGTFYDRAADIEIAANGDIYVTFGLFSEGRIFRSTDNGDTWVDISPDTNGERIEIAVAPSFSFDTDATVLYAAAAKPLSGRVQWLRRSLNGGKTWIDLPIPQMPLQGEMVDFTRDQAWYGMILQVHPQNPQIVLAGGIDLHKSLNGGNTWKQVSQDDVELGLPTVHVDQHAIQFRPENPNQAIFGHDGGVSISFDVGASNLTPSFEPRNNGYNVTQFYSCAVENIVGSNLYLGGTQDNGTQRFTSAGINTTEEILGGDGGYAFIDEDNPNFQIASTTFNNYYRSLDGGANFTRFSALNEGRFINPSDYDSRTDDLYAAGEGNQIIRYADVFGNMQVSTLQDNVLGAFQISSIRVSPHTNHRIFVGTIGGGIFRIDSTHQTPIFKNLDQADALIGNISSIDVGANDQELIITLSNYGIKSVWYSNDGGENWISKDENGYGLPDIPVRWVLFNPQDTRQVLLATEIGVWSTSDVQADNPGWEPTNLGLANVRCDMLRYRPSDGQVVIATHGRGIYTTDVFVGEPQPQITSLSLRDSDTDEEISKLENGTFINLALLEVQELAILANTTDLVQSVDMRLSGPMKRRQIEQLRPFSLFGDTLDGDLNGAPFLPGKYKLVLTPYPRTLLRGKPGLAKTVEFEVSEGSQAEVTGFSLIDQDTNEEIMPIEDGDIVDLTGLASRNLNIRVQTSPDTIGSLVMSLHGDQTLNRIENEAPYALFYNFGQKEQNEFLCEGSYNLRAIPYEQAQGKGLAGHPGEINFQILSEPQITGLNLIRTDDDSALGSLISESTVSLNVPNIELLSVSAEVSCAQSVTFLLRNTQGELLYETIENISPYALFGDTPRGDYQAGDLVEGDYILTAIPYSEPDQGGKMGEAMNLTFTLENSTITWQMGESMPALPEEISIDAPQLQVYPNPLAQDLLTLEFSEEIQESLEVEIISLQNSQPLLKTNLSLNAPTKRLDLDLSALSLQPGTYYLRVSSPQIPVISKMIIKQ